jgi:hypothetical protein
LRAVVAQHREPREVMPEMVRDVNMLLPAD